MQVKVKINFLQSKFFNTVIKFSTAVFNFVSAKICTFDEYIGKEKTTLVLVCNGPEYTSICTERLKDFKNVSTLVIENTSLKSIPDELQDLTNLENFKYMRNKSTVCFENLKKLKTIHSLDLSSNELTDLPFAITKLRNLCHLSLHDNNLSNLPFQIKSLQRLKTLDLSRNIFKTFPAVIELLEEELEKLDMSQNQLKCIPAGIHNLRYVQSLDFSQNHIESFNIQGWPLMCLESLNLANNKIEVLPSCISIFKNTEILNLSNNKIQSLPPELNKLKNLQKLDLRNNKLSYLPSEVCNLKQIKTLDISLNELKTLPKEFCNLKNLVILDLHSNMLSTIEMNFIKFQKLERLDISKNYLTGVPISICLLQKLQFLDLSFNKIRSLRPINKEKLRPLVDYNLLCKEAYQSRFSWIIKPIYMIYRMIFSKFSLSSRHDGIFNLQCLKYLHLSHNEIRSIPSKIKKLKELKKIDFSNNKISNVSHEMGKLLKLEYIDLSCNEIRELSSSFNNFKGKAFKLFDLSDNFIGKSKKGLKIDELLQLGIKNMIIGKQYTRNVTLSSALNNVKMAPMHWNIDALNSIKINLELSKVRDITDKQMRRLWDKVLKYCINDPEYKEGSEEDSFTSEGIAEDLIDKISNLNIVKSLEKCNILVSVSLRQTIKDYLKSISHDPLPDNSISNDTETNVMLKSYIKTLFVRFCEQIIDSNGNIAELELIRTKVTFLCNFSLNTCITGQMEGLKYFYSCDDQYENVEFEDLIKSIIASFKENCFMVVSSGCQDQNTHRINSWRPLLSNIIGITNDFLDPYENDYDFKEKIGAFVYEFFEIFTVDKAVQQILNVINKSQEISSRALDFLKQIVEKESIDDSSPLNNYESYSVAITRYFEYEFVQDFLEPVPRKIRTEGVMKILIELNILESN